MELKKAIREYLETTYAQDAAGLAHMLCNLDAITLQVVNDIESEFLAYKSIQISLSRSIPGSREEVPI